MMIHSNTRPAAVRIPGQGPRYTLQRTRFYEESGRATWKCLVAPALAIFPALGERCAPSCRQPVERFEEAVPPGPPVPGQRTRPLAAAILDSPYRLGAGRVAPPSTRCRCQAGPHRAGACKPDLTQVPLVAGAVSSTWCADARARPVLFSLHTTGGARPPDGEDACRDAERSTCHLLAACRTCRDRKLGRQAGRPQSETPSGPRIVG